MPRTDKFTAATWMLLLPALALSVAVLAMSWNLPLLEFNAYRQTQTAISSYWMATTTNWLAYPTPILGYPWSIPFEFPLFQGLALAVANLLPITLDQSGRLVSWVFALLTVFPLRACIKEITGRIALSNTFTLFYLLSPLYLYGTRHFMIESTALFFSVLFMATVVRYWRSPSPALFTLMVAAATLAGLVKITTFFAFGVMAAFFLAWKFSTEGGRLTIRRLSSRYAGVVAAVVISILVTALYVHFSDLQKAETLYGARLTSSNMSIWNFGTWQQRTSSNLWLGVAMERAPQELLGSFLVLPCALLSLAVLGKGVRGISACLAVGYAIPFLVFPNLHEVHNYYQQANGIFLLGVVACAVEAVRTRLNDVTALVFTVLIAIVMFAGFRRDFLPFLSSPEISQRTVALAAFARRETRPDDILLTLGRGLSPEVPYYATRRAMMIAERTTAETMRLMREQPEKYTGPFAVGLVIVCPNSIPVTPQLAEEYNLLIESVTDGRKRFRIAGCDVYK